MKAVGVHRKLFGLFLATVTVLTIMGVFIHLALQDREADRWVTRTYEIQNRLDSILLEIEAGQDANEDYRLNRHLDAYGVFTTSFGKAVADLSALDRLSTGSPDERLRLHALRRDINDYHAAMTASIQALPSPSRPADLVHEFTLLDRVHRSADSVKQTVQDQLERRTRTNRVAQRRVDIALVCFLVVVSLLLVSLFLAVRQDLLQQEAAARLRQANDQRIARILENMSDAFLAINRDWIVTYLNGQAEQVLHLPRAHAVGANLWDLFPGASDKEFGQQYRHAIAAQVTVRFEAFYVLHAAWYEVTAYPNEDGLAIFFTNINERRKAALERERVSRQAMFHAAAERRNQELQDLARRMVEMQEAERRHLAYELHEGVGQVLAGLKLTLASALKQPEVVRENQIRGSQDLVTQLMRHVRALSLDLRPGVLDDLGLLPALQWYCTHYTEQSEIQVDFTETGLEQRFDGTVETTAYRIVQEALAHCAHHGEVKALDVDVAREDDWLTVRVTDRSEVRAEAKMCCFCDPSLLTGIQERATLIGGAFEVVSDPGREPMIVARLPIHPVYTSLES